MEKYIVLEVQQHEFVNLIFMGKKVLKISIPKSTLEEKHFWVEGLLIKQCLVQILKSVNKLLGGELDARQMGWGWILHPVCSTRRFLTRPVRRRFERLETRVSVI